MTGFTQRLADHAETLGYRAGWRLVRALPERSAYAMFDRIADRMAAGGGRSVQRMRANYARVRPDLNDAQLDDLVRAGCRSYLRYWCDAFRLSVLSPAQVDERMRLTGCDADARARAAAGEPIVCFLGHLGNWDMAGAWSTTHFAHVTTVAERLKPESVFQEFLDFRTSLGMTILPLTGGVDVFPTLREALSRGGFVPLLADRDLSGRGVEVTLLGHRSKAAIGPARLAIETGAALYSLSMHYEPRPGGGHRVVADFSPRIEVPIDGTMVEKVQRMTQQCIDHLGRTIETHTEDWHMMQRVFLEER